jgi:DNA-binding PadR family transcriptional regulator
MGTKKIGTMVLATLDEEPKTFSEVKRSLSLSGMRCTSEELEKSILRLSRLGFLKIIEERPVNRYVLTALGQAVSENPKK